MRDLVRVVTRFAFVAFSFYLVAGVPLAAAGQATARPGVDCSLLTPTQAQGLVCATAPRAVTGPPLLATAFEPSEDACRGISPYTDTAKAVACAAWQRSLIAAPPLPTFTVGTTYVHPYPQIHMVVLAVSLSLDGIPVVTAQFSAGPDTGNVFAFRVDQGAPWTPLP